MPSDSEPRIPGDFGAAVGRIGPALLALLDALEAVLRRLHPPRIEVLRKGLAAPHDRLVAARAQLDDTRPGGGLDDLRDQLSRGARHADRSARLIRGREAAEAGPMAVLDAMQEFAAAQAALFPLRSTLPPLDAWMIESGYEHRLPGLAEGAHRDVPTGLFNASNDRAQRGGFTLFVPEDYEPTRPWPLVVALHGGFGHGADFVWTWVREARARGWLLLAPTSADTTWSLVAPELDGQRLGSMLEYVGSRWSIDAGRMLLTGLSDGATFSLLHGLAEGSPFTHLAPVAGVLHPLNFANGNLARASARRIHWVHGALDWMFPVPLAREAVGTLREAGAEVVYEEIEDLSHAYPRERNGPILEWAGSDR